VAKRVSALRAPGLALPFCTGLLQPMDGAGCFKRSLMPLTIQVDNP